MKKNNPLVSVVVPIYNIEVGQLRVCFESIKSQTYKNLEVILINDGSNKKTANYCDEFAKNLNNWQVIHQENKGLFGARITGFEIMHGDYFVTIDSDDYVSVDYIESLVSSAVSSKADITMLDGYNKVIDGTSTISKIPTLPGSSDNFDNFMQGVSDRKYMWNVWGRLYKASLYKNSRVHLTDIKGHITMGEDIIFSAIFAYFAKKIYRTKKQYGYYYIVNSESTTNNQSHQAFVKRLNDIINVIGEVETFIRRIKLYEKYRANILDFRSWQINDNAWTMIHNYKVEIDRLKNESANEINRLRNSRAYKLGNIMILPVRLIRKITRH